MHDNPVHEMLGSTENLIAAAKKRLELWDISDPQIERDRRQPASRSESHAVLRPSPAIVMERNAYPKQRVMPDTVLYTIADLSTVWVMADVFEYEAANVRIGQPRHSDPRLLCRDGHSAGRVSYILPQVDPATRTLKVRIEFANPELLLKPEMYGDVEFQTGGTRRLMVPQRRVLNSGDHQTVFVDRGNGLLRAARREDRRADASGRIEILSGLKAGERIVISGNFLIDSESQLKTARAGRQMIDRDHRVLGAQPLPGVPVRGGRGAGRMVVDATTSRSTPSPT